MGRFFHLFLTKEPPIFWSWVPMLPSVSASSNPAVDPAGSCCGQTPSCACPYLERGTELCRALPSVLSTHRAGTEGPGTQGPWRRG